MCIYVFIYAFEFSTVYFSCGSSISNNRGRRDAYRRLPGDENYDPRTLYLPPSFLKSLSGGQVVNLCFVLFIHLFYFLFFLRNVCLLLIFNLNYYLWTIASVVGVQVETYG